MGKKMMIAIALLIGSVTVSAQSPKAQKVGDIRKAYAEAKKKIADNGKNGQAPLDVSITLRDGTEVDEDFIINEERVITFYFTKSRANKELDYADGSNCYFITENWSANGHSHYREMLFDPNVGHLLFSFMHSETHAGYEVESRYYFAADGSLIDQKHKEGKKDVKPDGQTWSTAETEQSFANDLLYVFDQLMKPKHDLPAGKGVKSATTKADRIDLIRKAYTRAKEDIAKNDKSETPHDIQIVVREQSWGPPEITDVRMYYEQPDGTTPFRCYFISEHCHNNNMGKDNYSEFLIADNSLMFSYCCAREEGEKHEWRYYYDENGRCIEVKTDADDNDKGLADKMTAERYLNIFKKLTE